LNVFQHHKKLNLSFLEISGTGFPPDSRQFPPVSRQFPPVIVSTKFHILPELCLFAMHTASGCRLYQPHFTPFDPLKLQHVFMLPESAKIA
jgi:hypothetical protein